MEIKEKISYANFDSSQLNLWLTDRNAPTPKEKEVVQNIPYTHGENDFSMILGERFFEMRKLEYSFCLVEPIYEKRKDVEQEVKRQILLSGFTKLFDSHDKNGYWWAKCESIQVDDIHEKSQLKIKVIFIARPFFIKDSDYLQNLWNDFWYPEKYEQLLDYDVVSSKKIILWNGYDKAISPIIEVEGDGLSINYLGQSFMLKNGKNEFFDFELLKGLNELELIGIGKIHFQLLGEVMI
ncbi:hypothetical protein [Carnobacterium divergens]|uniref:hypothetical protein n=1 Tax=Carnobacterium divergens TaxID=2748 RepID=UPI0039C8E340